MGIRKSSARIAFRSEIDLLMYSTFAVQSGESARQQRLALVLSYVLLWSNRAVIHLDRDDSWINPHGARVLEGPAELRSAIYVSKVRHIQRPSPRAKLENPNVAVSSRWPPCVGRLATIRLRRANFVQMWFTLNGRVRRYRNFSDTVIVMSVAN
jgi:hypothetical protein